MTDSEDARPTDEASIEASEAVDALAVTSNYKVLGELTDAGGVGVLGQNNAASGTPIGVQGAVPNATGGYGLATPDDAMVGGDHEVTGSQSVGRVGVSAYISEDQTVPASTVTRLEFDRLRHDRDDFGGLDTSTGVYTVGEAGDYHVDFMVEWADSFSDGDGIAYLLEINDSTQGGIHAFTSVSGTTSVARSFSKTLFELTPGDTIDVRVHQASGENKDVNAGPFGEDTYLTIHKVG